MIQRIRLLALLFLSGTLAAQSAISQQNPPEPESRAKYRKCEMQQRIFDGYCWLSMVDLISNPELFDGQKVVVQGYVHMEFEGNGVYLHKDDFLYGNTHNALWLNMADAINVRKCQDTYATVKGTFKAGLGGHFDMYSGVLDHITECAKVKLLR